MSQMTLLVNGRRHAVDVDPATPLLFVLSDDLALKGPKFGCGLGQCGACTVIVRGQAIRSCVTATEAVQNTEITTLDGLGSLERPHPIQQAFIDEQATQCGFCLSGVILSAIVVFIIDRKFIKAAAFAATGGGVTFFGLMHGEEVGAFQNPSIVCAYFAVGGVLLVCSKLPSFAISPADAALGHDEEEHALSEPPASEGVLHEELATAK